MFMYNRYISPLTILAFMLKFFFFFFFNDTATTEIYTRPYTLSLHDALPISRASAAGRSRSRAGGNQGRPESRFPGVPAGAGSSLASPGSSEQIGRRLPEVELVQAPVPAAPGHHLGVRAAVDDATFLQQQHEICVRDRGQVVCDHETGLAGHQAIECLAHGRLAFHVETGHRLVQNQDRGVANERARDGDALPLPAGEGRAPLADDAVVPVFQLTDELVGVGGLGRRDDLVRARFGAAVRNIFPDGRAEQQRLLEHEPDLAPQRLAAIMADVDPVDEDRPFLGLVQTQDQADDGGLAGARCPDQGQPLPRRYLEGDLPQHVLAVAVIERHAAELDFASQGDWLDGVRAVLDLRLRVEYLGNAVRARHRFGEIGRELGQAAHRLVPVGQVAHDER